MILLDAAPKWCRLARRIFDLARVERAPSRHRRETNNVPLCGAPFTPAYRPEKAGVALAVRVYLSF